MPEESKKHQRKDRNEAKEQRKPRQARHQGGSYDKKHEKKAEEPRAPQKPVYEEPGPEFYQSLKRETDEILKITDEANSKYKKKEIQSNWSKYEMPIESYDEIEEQENMGADYEKLIETPLSLGGHFQFKHEKSWDTATGPSPYEKYFEINMDNLFLSISTVPFHERIDIDKSMYSETDILSMNNRATRFKQKYYNDKTFTTAELQMQDKIINSLGENISCNEKSNIEERDEECSREELEGNRISNEALTKQIQGLVFNENKPSNEFQEKIAIPIKQLKDATLDTVPLTKSGSSRDDDFFDDLIIKDEINKPQDQIEQKIQIPEIEEMLEGATEKSQPKQNSENNAVIESPEELEKWLDDFLDG